MLVEGAPGIGKSALALELLAQGHRLIADDAIEIRPTAAKTIIGRCPATLYGFLEIRGLGILDVRRHFGAGSLRRESSIDLIIRLDPRAAAGNRLTGNRRMKRLGGRSLPCTVLRPGHNLPVLVVAACRAEQLRRNGHDAATALAHRQQKAIQRRP